MSEISEETKKYMRERFNSEQVTTIVAAYAGTPESKPDEIVSLFIRLCDLTADESAQD